MPSSTIGPLRRVIVTRTGGPTGIAKTDSPRIRDCSNTSVELLRSRRVGEIRPLNGANGLIVELTGSLKCGVNALIVTVSRVAAGRTIRRDTPLGCSVTVTNGSDDDGTITVSVISITNGAGGVGEIVVLSTIGGALTLASIGESLIGTGGDDSGGVLTAVQSGAELRSRRQRHIVIVEECELNRV